MKIRGIDAVGDWLFGQGLGSYAQNSDEIAIDIRTRVQSWYGDCFFDPEAGVDWPHRFDKNQQANLLDELRVVISGTPGVVKVKTIVATPNMKTRDCFVSASVQTIFDPTFQITLTALLGGQKNA